MKSIRPLLVCLLVWPVLHASVAAAPPANDARANAILLPATLPVAVTGSNVDATLEPDEPDHAQRPQSASVWWRWTAGASGPVIVDTLGTSFDTVLAVYEEGDGGVLHQLFGDDDGANFRYQSTGIFDATAGKTYYCAVAAWGDSTPGSIRLSFQANTAPASDAFAQATQIPSELPPVLSSPTAGLTIESGEPDSEEYGTVWWRWNVTATGVFHLTSNHFAEVYAGTSLNDLSKRADADFGSWSVAFNATAGETLYIRGTAYPWLAPILAVELRANMPPANDHFASATVVQHPLPRIFTINWRDATTEAGEPNPADGDLSDSKTVWWRFTAQTAHTVQFLNDQATSELAVYQGTALDNLQEHAATSLSGGFLAFPVAAGDSYYLRALVPAWLDDEPTFESIVTLQDGPAAPGNDNIASATVITTLPVTINGTVAGATFESGETPEESSVWMKWTPAFTGFAVIELDSPPSTNAVIDFGTGDTVASFDPVIEDASGGRVSVESGTPCFLRVRGTQLSADGGNFSVRILPPPPNDDFASAASLPGSATSQTTSSNVGAGNEDDEPTLPGGPLAPSVWWSWVAPSSGSFTVAAAAFDTSGEQMAGRIGVFTGSSVSTLNVLASAADGLPAVFNAVAGASYYFRFDSFAQGTVILAVSPPPANDSIAAATVLSGPAPILATGDLLGATGETFITPDDGQSVWFAWSATWSGRTFAKVRNHVTGAEFEVDVFTGTAPDLTLVSGTNSNSLATFTPSAGTQYFLRVSKAGSRIFSPADFELLLSPAATNDSFADASVLSGSGPISVTTSLLGTDSEAGEPGTGVNYVRRISDHTAWWTWTAPDSMLVTIDTYGSETDTVLHVYTGTEPGSLTLQRASDNARAERDSRVAFVAQAGTQYHIRTATASDDDAWMVKLNLMTSALPATAAQHVAYGRSYLEGRTAADLTAADQHFQQAIALSSQDPSANALRAITRLATLQNAPAFTDLLSQWGIQSIRGGLHRPEYDTTKDAYGVRSAPLSANASQGTAYLNSEVLPTLVACDTHLQALPSNFTLAMTDSETANRWMNVDHGDVQILRALGFAFQAAIRMNNTLNTDGSLNEVLALENQKKLKAEHVLKLLPNLLKRRAGSDERTSFKTAIQQANTHYQAGSDFIRARVDSPDNKHHLFYIGAKRTRKEEELRENAAGLAQALDGPATWAGYTVNLTPLLTTETPYRDLLPKLKDNQAVASTAPDPTVQNSLPGGTHSMVNQILAQNDLLFFINSFADWAAIFLGNESPANQSPEADIDGDGFNNFAEYVFALDPLRATGAQEAFDHGLISGPSAGEKYFAITFIRRKPPTPISYKVWVSDNLATWDTTETQIELVGVPIPQPDGLTEQVTYRLTLPVSIASRRFLKVVATGS